MNLMWTPKPKFRRQCIILFRYLVVMHMLWLAQPLQAMAHPMGNFSINQFSELEIGQDAIRLQYVIDMAEIPTFQETQQHQLIPDATHPTTISYLRQQSQELQSGLSLLVNDQPVSLRIQSSTIAFPPGAGKLPTLRLNTVYEASLPTESGTITYEDQNFSGRKGWKEIIAHPVDGMTFPESSVPQISQSQQLKTYQEDLLQTPPQVRHAKLNFSLTTPQATMANDIASSPSLTETLASSGTGKTSPPHSLTELISSSDITFGTGILAMAIALGLGAFHALEPGHGKTLVAAYLVGSRGTPWHALLLGLTVTASHTIGVFALGAVTLFASQYFFPEQVYPWLGVTSGLLIVGTGLLLLQRITKTFRHHHDGHHHAHGEHHHHGHSHSHHSHDHGAGETTSLRSLLTLGITGGMIPCPAALVVLLSAVALNRIGFGLLLIVAFSAGLALVLVTIGLILVSARGFFQRWQGDSPWLRYLPYASPAVIVPLGLFIAIRSFIDTGLISDFFI